MTGLEVRIKLRKKPYGNTTNRSKEALTLKYKREQEIHKAKSGENVINETYRHNRHTEEQGWQRKPVVHINSLSAIL